MANCPNCSRSTARTSDWCCQWCGYPLFSSSFKKIDKTWKELKEERLAQESAAEEKTVENKVETSEPRAEDKSKDIIPEKPAVKQPVADEQPLLEKKAAPRQEPSPEHRTVRRILPVSRRPVRRRIIRRRKPAPPPEPVEEEYIEYYEEPEEETEEYYEDDDEEVVEDGYIEDEEEYEYVYEDEDENEEKPPVKKSRITGPPSGSRQVKRVRAEHVREPEPPVGRKIENQRRPAAEPEQREYGEDDRYKEQDDVNEEYSGEAEEDRDGPVAESTENKVDRIPEQIRVTEEPAPVQPAMELDAEALISAYETEGSGADARFANKVLKVTGIINKIDVKEALAVYALVLETPDAHPLRQTVRCVFRREQGGELKQLVKGQTVSVQGKYDGSIVNISMRDCAIVK